MIEDFLQDAGCEVYNLGTGKGTSVLEMVAAFEKASGKVLLFVFYYIPYQLFNTQFLPSLRLPYFLTSKNLSEIPFGHGWTAAW